MYKGTYNSDKLLVAYHFDLDFFIFVHFIITFHLSFGFSFFPPTYIYQDKYSRLEKEPLKGLSHEN